MSDKTPIEWTDASWNPIRGCSRVSEGCRHCYAERFAALRLSGPGRPYEGLARRSKDGEPRWTGKVQFVESVLEVPFRWTRPRRIFVNSMSDLFHENLLEQDVDRIFAVMFLASIHAFQVLTKRAGRMFEYLSLGEERVARIAARAKEIAPGWDGELTWPLPNVWLGVSAENQETADERIPLLLLTPAAVHFVSAEPLLGPLELEDFVSQRFRCSECGATGGPDAQAFEFCADETIIKHPRLDWIIAGGESGPRFRAADPEWFLSIRDQCVDAGVPFFFKQWGGLFPKSNGRMLEGRTWDQFPAAAAPT